MTMGAIMRPAYNIVAILTVSRTLQFVTVRFTIASNELGLLFLYISSNRNDLRKPPKQYYTSTLRRKD